MMWVSFSFALKLKLLSIRFLSTSLKYVLITCARKNRRAIVIQSNRNSFFKSICKHRRLRSHIHSFFLSSQCLKRKFFHVRFFSIQRSDRCIYLLLLSSRDFWREMKRSGLAMLFKLNIHQIRLFFKLFIQLTFFIFPHLCVIDDQVVFLASRRLLLPYSMRNLLVIFLSFWSLATFL